MRNAHLLEIRPYRPSDLDAAAEAANAACRQAYAYFGYNHPVPVTRTRLSEALAEGQTCFVPEVNGVVVGILTMKPVFIDKLFIAPHWQGFGIGRPASISPNRFIQPASNSTARSRITAPAASMSATASLPSPI
jgi:hypothetical protein